MITKARFQKIVALSDSEKKIPDIFDFDSMTRKEMEEFIANKNFPFALVKINPNDIYELLKNGSSDDENLCRSYIRKMLFKVLNNRKKEFGFDENNPVIKNSYDLSNLKQRSNLFFRGQANCEWHLSPSLIRANIPENESCIYFDGDSIQKHYEDLGVARLYRKLFKRNYAQYDFCSFLQHAASYTPFIDFTRKPEIATFFAAHEDENGPKHDKGAVYVFEVKNGYVDAGDFNLRSFKGKKGFYCMQRKLKPGETIKFKNAFDLTKESEAFTFSDPYTIKDYLTPEIMIFENKTNDRMKAQKGVFFLFYGFLMVENNILYRLSDQIESARKIIIADKGKALTEARRKFFIRGKGINVLDCLYDPYEPFSALVKKRL